MRNVEVSIPHRLGRVEARRRIVEGLPQLRSQLGMLGHVEERWNGDVMHFTGSAMGTTVSGQLSAGDEVVRVEVALPWALAMLVGGVKQTIETETRKLLEAR